MLYRRYLWKLQMYWIEKYRNHLSKISNTKLLCLCVRLFRNCIYFQECPPLAHAHGSAGLGGTFNPVGTLFRDLCILWCVVYFKMRQLRRVWVYGSYFCICSWERTVGQIANCYDSSALYHIVKLCHRKTDNISREPHRDSHMIPKPT